MLTHWGIASGLLGVVIALGYFRMPFLWWSGAFLAALMTATWHHTPGGALLTTAWVAWALLTLLFGFIPLRRRLISTPLMKLFHSALPPLSPTEREAMEAGTVWWDRELFDGRPDWRKLLEYGAPSLTAEEQGFLDGPVEELCRMLDDWEATHVTRDLPPEVWRFIKEQGFFGLIIPKRYGGREFSAQAHSAVVTRIASRSLTAAVTVMVPNSLGPAELLLRYGTQEQKDRYLPRLASGEEVPCFALTSPHAGSDAGAMPDHGVVCRGVFQGEEVVGIRLNWEKRYITLGPVATVLGLAFKLHDPERLLGGPEEPGITVALIPTDTPGVTIGQTHNPLDVPFQNGPNWGRDVFIPTDWLIGGPPMAGQGWRMLMECLAEGRSISLPALSSGGSKVAARISGAYARVRRQFKLPVGRFEGVQEPLARIAAHTYLIDAARQLTALAVDRGERPSVISAIIKRESTERMRQVINDAMDVVGGAGICMGPRNQLGRIYQGVPIGITVEGANILTRSLITFGQGAMRAHPFLLKEVLAVGNPDPWRGVRDFDAAFFGHVGFTVSNLIRSLWLGLTGSRFTFAPMGMADGRYFRHLTRLSGAFALVADLALLTLGGALKRKEFLSGRLADALSHLYLGSAALKRFHDQGRPREDLPLLDWALRHCLHRIQESLYGVFANHPWPPLGWLLRLVTFPYGRTFDPPDDHLTTAVAELLLTPSEARDRLTAGIFWPDDPEEFNARLESALLAAVAAEPAETRLRQALRRKQLTGRSDGFQWEETLLDQALATNLLTETEVEAIRRSDALRTEVIAVDHFPAPGEREHNGH